MPVDPALVIGAPLPSATRTWSAPDVMLYHLGIGAGAAREDLRYTYEQGLVVLPTFAVVLFGDGLGDLQQVPGLSFDPALVLHGEQELEIHQPLPAEGTVTGTSRVTNVFDKGKGALLIVETDVADEAGSKIATLRASIFLRGEGGFGGDSGTATPVQPPAREPDVVVASPTREDQALLYRLNADFNPLHADPAFAAAAGFPKPILHGLCTYGVVCKAAVDHMLEGDTTAVRRYAARFAGIVFPGETIVTSMWREDGRVHLQAETKEREAPVLTNGVIDLR